MLTLLFQQVAESKRHFIHTKLCVSILSLCYWRAGVSFITRFFFSNFFHMCYLRMRQDSALLTLLYMMARADTVDCVLAPTRQKCHAFVY